MATEDSSGSGRPSTPPNPVTGQSQDPKTPPPNPDTIKARESVITVTPRDPRTDASNLPVTIVRDTIAKEMNGEFVTCPIKEFIKHYMPFAPPEEHVRQLIDKDIEKGSTIFIEDSQRIVLKHYTKPPTSRTGTEARLYKSLKQIADVVADFEAPPDRQRNDFKYLHCPNTTMRGDIPGLNNRIDGCFWSGQEEKELHVSDIAVAIEQKLSMKHTHTLQNNKQLVSMNVQIMNDDIRRMFIFGMTIESDKVCLFYQSRSHSAISHPFYFVEEPWRLIQVFMAFMFATHEQLGYDPMVKKEPVGDGVYTYEIPSPDGTRFFRTNKALAFYRSNNITGRTTRVWSVTEVDEEGNTVAGISKYVLKDVWLGRDAKTEKEIQEEIFDDIEKFFKSESDNEDHKLKELRKAHAEIVEKGRYKDYFMTIVTDCTGKTSLATALNSTRTKNTLVDEDLNRSYETKSSQSVRTTTGSHRPINFPLPSTIPRDFLPRKQYRVIFEEECEALRDLKTLGEMVDAIFSALTPLELLLGAGWVHRDISCGNLLVNKCNGKSQIKLSDLEYAKRFDLTAAATSTDPKTGTAYYMATELLQNAYIVTPGFSSSDTGESDVSEDEEDSETSDTEPELHEKPIVHNFQHDLECLFWILLRAIIDFIENIKANELARDIFQNVMGQTAGRRFRLFHGSIRTELRSVLPPHIVKPFASLMDRLRKLLRKGYGTRENRSELEHQYAYVKVYQRFGKQLKVLREHATRGKWESTPLGRHGLEEVEPVRVMLKRSLDNAGLDETEAEPETNIPEPELDTSSRSAKRAKSGAY